MKIKKLCRERLDWALNIIPWKGGFVRDVTILAGGTIFGQSLVVLASPIITRLYKPSDFGILAVYSSVLGIASVVASLRYEMVVPLPANDEEAANVVGLALSIVLAISLFTAAVSLFFGAQVTNLVKAPMLKPYLWLLPIGVALIGTYQVLNYWAVRKKSFGLIARTKLNQSIGSVSIQIGLGISKLGPLGLLIGQVVGLAAGASTLFMLFWRQVGKTRASITPKKMVNLGKRYSRFPSIAAPAASLNSITIYMPAILLAALYGPKVAGWFALAQRAIGVPLDLVSRSIAQVYIGKAAPLARSSAAKLQTFFLRLFSKLALIGLLMLVPIVLIAPKLFVIIFGPGWEETGAYLPRLAPLFIAQFITAPFGGTLDILERQGLFLMREIFRAIIILFSFVIMKSFRMSARNAMMVLGFAGALGYAIYIVSVWIAIKQNTLRDNRFR